VKRECRYFRDTGRGAAKSRSQRGGAHTGGPTLARGALCSHGGSTADRIEPAKSPVSVRDNYRRADAPRGNVAGGSRDGNQSTPCVPTPVTSIFVGFALSSLLMELIIRIN